MNSSFHYLNTAQVTGNDNHVLFTILFTLRFENDYISTEIDIDQPISSLYSESFDRNNLTMVLSLVELLIGCDIPDEFIRDEWTIRRLSNEIRRLPKMTDEAFSARLVSTKSVVNASWFVNYLRENGSMP